MSTILLPVDPAKKDDVHYRYKMPATQTKIEGSGNGIKTVLPNIHDLCEVLHRPEFAIIKFLQNEMGAQGTINEKDDKYLLMGSHTNERMQEKIYEFIKKFVLCSKCSNPETLPMLQGKNFAFKCAACNHVTVVESSNRTGAVLHRYYTDNPKRLEDDQSKVKTDTTNKVEESVKVSTTKTRTALREVDDENKIADDRETDYVVAARMVSQNVDNHDELYNDMVHLLETYSRTEVTGPIYLLHGILRAFPGRHVEMIRKTAPVFRRLCCVTALADATSSETDRAALQKREFKIQQQFLFTTIKTGFEELSDPGHIVILYFVYYIEEIVRDTVIASFVQGKHCPAEVAEKAMPLVQWLELEVKKEEKENTGDEEKSKKKSKKEKA